MDAREQSAARRTRNPFGVMDVPEPDGADVAAFARSVVLGGSAEDPNSQEWHQPVRERVPDSLEGKWSSRWNGEGLDWHTGQGELRTQQGNRIYILFDWDDGSSQGIIEARQERSNRLVGRYLNLNDPSITRPWVGVVVDDQRIDGQHSGGRIDFRR